MDSATLPIQSDYETERGKPMPSKLHSVITQRLTVFLVNRYGDKFEILPELTLDTPGERTTPDIAICEPEAIDFSKDEVKRKEPPLATIEILSPTQILQTLLDKTNEYFSFGVKSCWVILPTLKTIYVYSAPYQFEVFSPGDEVFDAKLDIRLPIDTLFAPKSVGK
ncbi:MAG: Uma2 family endonuclease [Lewinellaceae bacterium]|nr:Uma2 family endonuclease [Saprospiraceae bacterium]MCB9336792.1 Uma2 family endonuclease [Lewinellaceae bacterium]